MAQDIDCLASAAQHLRKVKCTLERGFIKTSVLHVRTGSRMLRLLLTCAPPTVSSMLRGGTQHCSIASKDREQLPSPLLPNIT